MAKNGELFGIVFSLKEIVSESWKTGQNDVIYFHSFSEMLYMHVGGGVMWRKNLMSMLCRHEGLEGNLEKYGWNKTHTWIYFF